MSMKKNPVFRGVNSERERNDQSQVFKKSTDMSVIGHIAQRNEKRL